MNKEPKAVDVPMTELPMDMVEAVASGRVKKLHDIQVRVMASMLVARERMLLMKDNLSFQTLPTGVTNVSYYETVVAQIYKAQTIKNTFSVWSRDGKTPLGDNFHSFSEAVKFVIQLIQEDK